MKKKVNKRKSSLKEVIVKSSDKWKKSVLIEHEIFEDCLMEGATRLIEENHNKKGFTTSIILHCYLKEDEKNLCNHYTYNIYYVLVNAALYEKAERVRETFKKTHGVDLKFENMFTKTYPEK